MGAVCAHAAWWEQSACKCEECSLLLSFYHFNVFSSTACEHACPARHLLPAGKSSLQVPSNPWRVQSSAVFGRLDAFMGRCHDVLDVCNSTLQFNRLERVEMGGSKVRWRAGHCGALQWA